MIKINFSLQKEEKAHQLIPVFESDIKDGTLKKLTKIELIPDFKAEYCEIYSILNPKTGSKIILVGLGNKSKSENISAAIRKAVFNNRKLAGKIEINLTRFNDDISDQVIIGATLGTYNLTVFKQVEKKKEINAIHFVIDAKEKKELIKKSSIQAKSMMNVMDLVNKPSNLKTPFYLADYAEESARKNGFEVTVFRGEEVLLEKLHALYAVGKGSKNPPAFIVMKYNSGIEGAKTVGLIGKGISFDTGGISIKPSTNMHYMKSDMSGAAAVMGTMEVVAQLKLAVNLIAIVPSAENAVDGNAYRPGDIIQSYSGKSIEVIDTDAEGRLVLADGLAYMVKNFKPDYMIDLATLTGSCVATLGYFAAGMFTSNEEMAESISNSGKASYDRVWRLPIWDDYKSYMNSDMADIKNLSSVPVAGAITGAKFLEFFTENHKAWVHLDIAGVSLTENDLYKSRTATAYGVRLLTHWITSMIK